MERMEDMQKNISAGVQPQVAASGPDEQKGKSNKSDNLTRLEKLEARMAKLRRQMALEKRKESDKQRKERTHRLVRTGGLVEMVLGEDVDAGLLTGILMKSRSLFEQYDSERSRELKAAGDRLIAEREAAAKTRSRSVAEAAEDERHAV